MRSAISIKFYSESWVYKSIGFGFLADLPRSMLIYLEVNMPRNRMIKHDFWADEKVGELSINARLLFIGSWNFADDIGVFRGKPAYLRSNIFPYDDVGLSDIKKMCDEIKQKGLILEAKNNGETFYLIKRFHNHQKINRPSSFRFIKDTEKHNVLDLFNSVSAHGVISECSWTKVKEKEKDKEKDKVKEKVKVKDNDNGKELSEDEKHKKEFFDSLICNLDEV